MVGITATVAKVAGAVTVIARLFARSVVFVGGSLVQEIICPERKIKTRMYLITIWCIAMTLLPA
jgi:hypothetical protein